VDGQRDIDVLLIGRWQDKTAKKIYPFRVKLANMIVEKQIPGTIRDHPFTFHTKNATNLQQNVRIYK
jgi:hypothetical protein